MNKKIILFDIDDTLIEVHKLSEICYEQMANELGLPIEKIIKAKEEYKLTLERGSDYESEKMITHVCQVLGADPSKINNPFLVAEHYKKSLFPEVREILNKLSKIYTLGIFSEGFIDHQSRKINLSGISDYFNKDLIFIERRKLESDNIKKIENGVTIIDDRKIVIETLKELGKFNLVWLNRNSDEKMNGVRTIKSLAELI